jgi:hypothetical protein
MERQLDELDDYVERFFVDPCPYAAGSQPILLQMDGDGDADRDCEVASSDGAAKEPAINQGLAAFRVLGSILTRGIQHLFPNLQSLGQVTPAMIALLHTCFRVTGFDFIMNANPTDPLVSKCLPQDEPTPRCVCIPLDASSKTTFVRFLIHPVQ